MSMLITNIQAVSGLWRNKIVKSVISSRGISRAPNLFQTESNELNPESENLQQNKANSISALSGKTSYINKDRSIPIPVETSIKYMQSEAYKITYGDQPVWKLYRRNFKGQFPPSKTRKTCVRSGEVSTGNPCPICRDEYLVLDHTNTELLNQFISPHNGEILSFQVTHICQSQYKNLLVAIQRGRDYGTLTYDPPHRTYNYSHWYKSESTQN